jgi:xanthine dehydrogenase accessory factor
VEALVRNGGAGVVRRAGAGDCLPDRSAGGNPGQNLGAAAILVESRLARPRMLVFGANDFGAALLPAVKLLGYHVTLVDARPAFASQPRFAAADQVVTDWPHRYLAAESDAGRLDSRTVAAVLTHDPKFDLPLLETALALDLAYVGAMGSRRSHLQRVDDLLAAGVEPGRIAQLHSPIGLDLAYVGAMGSRRSHLQRVDDLLAAGVEPGRIAQLHSPIGLDLGAVTPAEVAVSITAELIASRSRAASCTPLRETSGPIHQHPAQQPPHQAPRQSAPTKLSQEIAWT